ncbi:hypothetical protein Glove_86g30 [Diversispora epigaea]|uniref:Uncharacterized protein n=1 Tax=Diversispora epigaea TaxID=1348612 RepID=A0A397JFR6_9GLOM|nr:hypothetical protein Glove_86g30 [Diversispora epigaea]
MNNSNLIELWKEIFELELSYVNNIKAHEDDNDDENDDDDNDDDDDEEEEDDDDDVISPWLFSKFASRLTNFQIPKDDKVYLEWPYRQFRITLIMDENWMVILYEQALDFVSNSKELKRRFHELTLSPYHLHHGHYRSFNHRYPREF